MALFDQVSPLWTFIVLRWLEAREESLLSSVADIQGVRLELSTTLFTFSLCSFLSRPLCVHRCALRRFPSLGAHASLAL